VKVSQLESLEEIQSSFEAALKGLSKNGFLTMLPAMA
jgi:hypothetical protein